MDIHYRESTTWRTRIRAAKAGFFSILGFLILSLFSPQYSQAVTKKKFDFVVGVDGDFKAAMTAAASNASTSNRFYIFFPDGEYNIGQLTGDANQKTTFSTSNVSLIGQSADKTVVYNQSINEGISITATLFFSNAHNLYLQDLTILNKANYGRPETYSVTGRHVAIQEQGNKIIYKNVKLLSTQDTYYTKGTRTYWENGVIHGTTDFICGGGDVFFNGCTLYALKKSALTAPATNTSWGYVFKDCTIDGDVSGFTLGRSWGDARAVFIDATMKQLPSDAGWGDPMNSVPKVFAEYRSKTPFGALVDLSKRRTTYTKGTTTVTLNPVLSDAEAANYTIANVLSGADNWQPQNNTLQIAAPVIQQFGSQIQWEDNANALCWAVFKSEKFIASVTTNSFDLAGIPTGESITVRAANEMGGLGPVSNALVIGAGPQHNLALSVQGLGTISPGSGSYNENQIVTLTASPADGWWFDHWSGDLSGSTNPNQVAMDANRTISAAFLPADKFSYQAEIGILQDAIPESKNTGFSGSGYVNYSAAVGASLQIPLYVEQAGTIKLIVTYANGSGAARSLSLSINRSVQVVSSAFDATTDWTTWQTKEFDIPVVAGFNVLALATINGQDGPNIDKVTLDLGPTIMKRGIRPPQFSCQYNSANRSLQMSWNELETLTVKIYSLDGTIVSLHQVENSSGTGRVQLSLDQVKPGKYFVLFDTKESVWTESLQIR